MKVLQALRIVVRSVQVTVWVACAGIAGWSAHYFQQSSRALEMSAPQQAAFAGATLVDLMVVYMIARATDRVFGMLGDGLQRREQSQRHG